MNAERKKEVTIFLVTICLHILILLLAFGAYRMQNQGAGLQYLKERFTTAGDSPHYLFLAEEGYQSEGDQAKLIVFYPLYPFLMRVLGVLLLGNYELAGLLISNICAGLAGVYLYKLVRLDYGEQRAVEAVLLFLLYPFMMFTMGVYTESLFLLLTLAALYQIRQGKWVQVGLLGFAAALCRTQGMLLLAPAVYEWLHQRAESGKSFREYASPRDMSIFLMPVGFLCYLLLNYVKLGDFRAFWEFQQAPPWYQSTHWINANITKDYGMALDYRGLSFIIYWVQIVLIFLALAVLFYGIRKGVRTSLIVYGGIYTCFCYLTGWLISGPRYMLGCVSLFVIFAAVERERVRYVILGVSAVLCMVYTILYIQGQAIM